MEPNNNGAGSPAPAPNTNGGQPATPPAGTTPPAPAPADANGASNGGEAPTLTDDQLKLAFEHPRFKELTQAAQQLKALQDEKAKSEQKALEEQGKFKELADQREAEANDWKTKYESSIKNNAIIVAANKLGAHDASTVAKLVDSGAITLNEDGTASGVDEAVAALQTANPYLFKTGSATKIGGGDTNPQGGANAEFTASQFKDAEYYGKNSEAMDKAMREGRVDLTK
jgi:hypothetical protein